MDVLIQDIRYERIQVLHFTEDYLSMRGVSPIIGRDFVREDADRVPPSSLRAE